MKEKIVIASKMDLTREDLFTRFENHRMDLLKIL